VAGLDSSQNRVFHHQTMSRWCGVFLLLFHFKGSDEFISRISSRNIIKKCSTWASIQYPEENQPQADPSIELSSYFRSLVCSQLNLLQSSCEFNSVNLYLWCDDSSDYVLAQSCTSNSGGNDEGQSVTIPLGDRRVDIHFEDFYSPTTEYYEHSVVGGEDLSSVGSGYDGSSGMSGEEISVSGFIVGNCPSSSVKHLWTSQHDLVCQSVSSTLYSALHLEGYPGFGSNGDGGSGTKGRRSDGGSFDDLDPSVSRSIAPLIDAIEDACVTTSGAAVTARTMLQMLPRRLPVDDEIGHELISNVLLQVNCMVDSVTSVAGLAVGADASAQYGVNDADDGVRPAAGLLERLEGPANFWSVDKTERTFELSPSDDDGLS
jgi:hypothetical protein